MKGAVLQERAWSESLKLSPEIEALIACGRAFVNPNCLVSLRDSLSGCGSPDLLCETAMSHGMLGHLHRFVMMHPSLTTDPALAHRLSELQRAAAMRSLRQTSILIRLLEDLETAGIRAMPIKGPAWADDLYGDISMRIWSDLDLLLRHSDVLSARDVLLAHGLIDSGPFNVRVARRHRGGLGQISLCSPTGETHVELHWEVTVGISSRSLEPESAFARAQSLELLDRAVMCPARSDQFLITCLEGSRDRWDTVEKLLGLAVQIDRMTAQEWPILLAEARKAGCLRRVCIGVGHVCTVLGLERVTPVDEVLSRDRMARALAGTLRPGLLSTSGSEGSRQHMDRLLWSFVSEDRLLTGLGHAVRRLVQPGPEDWASYSLPRGLQWLYGPLRPARLALKWSVRSLWHDREARRASVGRDRV